MGDLIADAFLSRCLLFDLEVRRSLKCLRDEPCTDAGCAYCRKVQGPRAQLRRYFHFDGFLAKPEAPDGGGLQKDDVRQGHGGKPLLAVMSTGGGKSLCFQLPALARHRRRGVITIVISPHKVPGFER